MKDAIDGWLAEEPLSVEELARRAVEGGLASDESDDDGMSPEDHVGAILERSDGYWTFDGPADERVVVSTATFIDTGMTFTHRVTAAELEAEACDEIPDLSVLLWESVRAGLPLDDGSGSLQVDYLKKGKSRIDGPPDWVEAVQPGDLLAFTRDDGVVSVDVIDAEDLDDGVAEREALTEAASRWIGDGRGIEEVPIVMEAMARNPNLFRRPVAPVGELMKTIGLERRGIEWGWADEEWQTRREIMTGGGRRIRQLYGLGACCDRAYDRIADAFRAHRRGEEVDGRRLADDLSHAAATAAVVHVHELEQPVLEAFAKALVETSSGRRRAPALTFLGLAQMRGSDADLARESFEVALRADPGFPDAAGPLALLELDRGDLFRAHALAVQDGTEPDLVDWIAAEIDRRRELRPKVGRNDPCPCGSGKKAKRCCGERRPLTLADRVPFVRDRLANYTTGPEGHQTVFGLASTAAGMREDHVEAVRTFSRHPFILDLAVHEGGLGDEYLELRASLLPDDEFEFLERALYEPRRFWKITAAEPGRSLSLRDAGSGVELTVAEQPGSEGREPGEYLLARVVTVDDEPMLFGAPVAVPHRARARARSLVEGEWTDPDDLARWFGSLFLPPGSVDPGDEAVDDLEDRLGIDHD